MKTFLTISIFTLLTSPLLAQKVRLEGDNSPFLCKNDSISETSAYKMKKNRIDSMISILYDFDNGRLPNSRRILIWTHSGKSYIRLIEGCDKIVKDTTWAFNSEPLWEFIKTNTFKSVSVPINSAYSQSHDEFYHITISLPKRDFFIVVRNYERKVDDRNKNALKDTRVILTNMIDNLLN